MLLVTYYKLTSCYSQTSLEEKAVNQRITEGVQEILHEVRLRRQISVPVLPALTEETEVAMDEQQLAVGTPSISLQHEEATPAQIEEATEDLDGFRKMLRNERDHINVEHEDSPAVAGLGIMDFDATDAAVDLPQIQATLQQIESQLERARSGRRPTHSQRMVPVRPKRNETNYTFDSAYGGSIMSTSPESREGPFSTSPKMLSSTSPPGPSSPMQQQRSYADSGNISPMSPTTMAGPSTMSRNGSYTNLGSPSSPRAEFPGGSLSGSAPTTAQTTPAWSTPSWSIAEGQPMPNYSLPPPATSTWTIFSDEAKLSFDGWTRPWACEISYHRRDHDAGLSLQVRKRDGSNIMYHDFPPLKTTVPHTSHTGAHPDRKNTVLFKDHHGHRIGTKGRLEEKLKGMPKYTFDEAPQHKEFQELIYGCELLDSWDTKSISSDRGKESQTQTLRVWLDKYTHVPFLLCYLNVPRRGHPRYIQEPKTAFSDIRDPKKKTALLKLSFQHQTPAGRAGRADSFGSGGSGGARSDSSARPSSSTTHFQYLEIEFASTEARSQFVEIWQNWRSLLQNSISCGNTGVGGNVPIS